MKLRKGGGDEESERERDGARDGLLLSAAPARHRFGGERRPSR